jgi:hypothetical protein
MVVQKILAVTLISFSPQRISLPREEREGPGIPFGVSVDAGFKCLPSKSALIRPLPRVFSEFLRKLSRFSESN